MLHTQPDLNESTDHVRVATVDMMLCPLELPFPVRLGNAAYADREYVVVRITDTDGNEGFSFGYTRGIPLLPLVEHAARGIVNTEVRAREETLRRLLSTTPSVRSTLVRATSLLDIALWDVAGKHSGLALSGMLGVAQREVPVMAVAGYFRDQRGDDAVIAEILELERSGYARVKLMLGALGTPQTMAFLERARTVLADTTQLAVDAHYSFRTVNHAAQVTRSLADMGIWMLEDPFPPVEWRRLREIAAVEGIEIAVGEDVSDVSQFLDLVEHATILRVDPTTSGGIRAAMSVIEAAALRGRSVIPHVFTGLSAQLAAAYPNVTSVEYIPSATKSDPIDEFLLHPTHVTNGILVIDDAPGASTGLDWHRLRKHSTMQSTVR